MRKVILMFAILNMTNFANAMEIEVHAKDSEYLKIGDAATHQNIFSSGHAIPARRLSRYNKIEKISSSINARILEKPIVQYHIRIFNSTDRSFTLRAEVRIIDRITELSARKVSRLSAASLNDNEQVYYIRGVKFGGYAMVEFNFKNIEIESMKEVDRVLNDDETDKNEFKFEMTRIMELYGRFKNPSVKYGQVPQIESKLAGNLDDHSAKNILTLFDNFADLFLSEIDERSVAGIYTAAPYPMKK